GVSVGVREEDGELEGETLAVPAAVALRVGVTVFVALRESETVRDAVQESVTVREEVRVSVAEEELEVAGVGDADADRH
ncbi:MAG: hypothetical protein P4L40_01530, partial [Terracidiphilus sp.]|nr:hypothetical protein [Terracidiphilus sp.]